MAETKKNEGKQENVQDNQDNQAATATVAAPSDSVAEAADPKPAKPVSKTVKAGEGFTHVNVRFKPDGKAKVKDLHRVYPTPENGWFELEAGGYVKGEFLE